MVITRESVTWITVPQVAQAISALGPVWTPEEPSDAAKRGGALEKGELDVRRRPQERGGWEPGYSTTTTSPPWTRNFEAALEASVRL